ncbi:putative DNA-binding transcriptional regulator YafY [Povalibacter uvarum]|uniref:Putative DNA-binding transcriptional regulator YafY n=1 Tax=Povalibacter uvarum TaxID=732238 RepID=A0A841HNJ7_9GAMM|nr:YafY family protein [Povalibacter uvarum]MBB6094446.1 putative DNA-binding transcriptional regulator YafY [Povalibacter uvarum]
MRAERLISLLMALQRSGRQTAGELANRLDVSMRTIFRDIDALSAMGVPVYSEPGRGGGIRLIEGYTSDLTGLSSGEAEALALIASPASIGTSELATPTRTALDKLAAAVPSMHQLRAQHARGRMLFDTKAWFRASVASPFLDEIRACVWNDECLDIVYQRGDGTLAEYEVQPYALVVKVDTWYLVGQRRKPGQSKPELRVYRLSRMQSLKRTARTFQRDPDFDLHKFWHGWCERFEKNPPHNFSVDIVLSTRGRKHLLETYGNWFRARLEPLGDKPGKKAVTLDFDHEDAAMRVLFQLGDDVDIVKPRALRRRLGALAARVLVATK